MCRNMLFLHAISGCDATSRPYGIGKAAVLKKFPDSVHFQEQANVFDAAECSLEDVIQTGEKVLVELYGGKAEENLNKLRHRKYHDKVCTRGRQLEPQNLPPTSAAAKYHSLRVFLQVKQWQGRDESMLIENWGWKLCNGQVVPIATDLPAAPERLLRMIRCNCTADCSTARCTCRKHGLHCSIAFGQCRGTGCTNNNLDLDPNNDSDDD